MNQLLHRLLVRLRLRKQPEVTIGIKVIRKDGTVEDHGIVSRRKVSAKVAANIMKGAT